MPHHQSEVSGVDRHANTLSLTPSNLCRISAIFQVLTLCKQQSRVALYSGKRRKHLGVLCHWHRCTRREYQRCKCRLHYRKNRQKVQGPCGWVCLRWCMFGLVKSTLKICECASILIVKLWREKGREGGGG